MGFIIDWWQYYLIIHCLDFNKSDFSNIHCHQLMTDLARTKIFCSVRLTMSHLKEKASYVQKTLSLKFKDLWFQCLTPLLLTCDSSQVITLSVKWLIIWHAYRFFRMTEHIKKLFEILYTRYLDLGLCYTNLHICLRMKNCLPRLCIFL